jgi:hypothetical protein
MKRRLLLSAAITLTVPLVLGVVAWLAVDVFGLGFPEWMVTALGYFGWPLLLIQRFIPASDSPDPNAPLVRMILYIAVVLCDFIVYCLVIFVILSWRARKRASVR